MSSAPQSFGTAGDKYEVIGNIGRGSFGIISKVKRKTDGKVLCRKEINYLKMSTKEREQLQAEINILSSLRHPNIVSYYHREHMKETQDLHLYMEYCGGGDLSKVINRLAAKGEMVDEAYVWNIMAQLVGALYRCHYGVDPPVVPDNVMSAPKGMGLRAKNQWTILHRDLKPENIFLGDDDSVKLGDFGLSKSIQGNDFASTYVGTPYYMSPEICAGERYSLKSDIWSMGCILYELCTTRPPFDAKTHIELVQKIRQGAFKPLPSAYSMELSNMISSCLKVNPQKRPATHELLDMPVIRLMRKEREVLEMSRMLKAKQEETEQLRLEAEALMKSLDQDKQTTKQEINDALRREWEVKARLEIDRQVNLEREALSQKWDEEFPKSVAAAVAVEMQKFHATQASQHLPRSTSPETVPSSSVYTSQTNLDDFTTDLSSLSVLGESPFKKPESKKRAARTPFTRDKARTQIDSPMDIHMASPSPVSINSLSLSPRRNDPASRFTDAPMNLFTAAGRRRWKPNTLSPAVTDEEDFSHGPNASETDDDEVPELPSPTLARGQQQDPFKAIRPSTRRTAASKRPSLGRQQTAPANRLASQEVPTLFTARSVVPATEHSRPQSPTGDPSIARSTSPTRERRTGTGLKAAKTDGDMLRDAVKRNAGRTLVELQQEQLHNRALATQAQQGVLTLPPKEGGSNSNSNSNKAGDKENAAAKPSIGQQHHHHSNTDFEDVAVWDPETCDEMPSPFLARGKGRGILPIR